LNITKVFGPPGSGKTTFLLGIVELELESGVSPAAIGYFAHHKRRNQALWQPTDSDRDQFVKTELDPMLRDVAVMADVMRSSSSMPVIVGNLSLNSSRRT
jgi:molybdopterin-guanine dinucleotide biosynthesis protein